MGDRIRVAVLGAGGLGQAAAKIIGMKKNMRLVAICDSKGYTLYQGAAASPSRRCSQPCAPYSSHARRCKAQGARDSIGEIIKIAKKGLIDGIFVALPNMPNNFIPSVAKRFANAGANVVFTDALKRTKAAELMFKLDTDFKKAKSVYITGCGATPGLLSAAAVLAAQSFIKVEDVRIWWGVGISNWQAYKATIREDIAHLPGYDIKKAKAMNDKEVDALLDKTDGKLELHNMEHADDILLKRVGVVDSLKQVEVGGVMDTRHAKKPVSTTMTLRGVTFDGKRSCHRFILGDETTMSANVIGPALGYLKRALWLKEHKIFGVFGSTEFMPMVVK